MFHEHISLGLVHNGRPGYHYYEKHTVGYFGRKEREQR